MIVMKSAYVSHTFVHRGPVLNHTTKALAAKVIYHIEDLALLVTLQSLKRLGSHAIRVDGRHWSVRASIVEVVRIGHSHDVVGSLGMHVEGVYSEKVAESYVGSPDIWWG
jgi:hypothetical protein